MHFVYLVYFSRSPFGEGGKRILNVLLASHHKGEQNDVLVISVFFFFEVLLCRRDCMFLGDYFIFLKCKPRNDLGFPSLFW